MQRLTYWCLAQIMLFGLLFVSSAQASNVEQLRQTFLTPHNDYVFVVAHRACWEQAPENSLQAIHNCIAHQVDMVELDVRETKDGVLVLLHDSDVARTTNGSGAITELTLAEVQKLRLRERDGHGLPLTHERVPTLREALLAAKGKILINIDAKADLHERIFAEVEATETDAQVLLKMRAAPNDPALTTSQFIQRALFMPVIVQCNEQQPSTRFCAEQLTPWIDEYAKLNAVAFEVVFNTPEFLFDAIAPMRAHGRVWVNTLKADFSAGLSDAKAVADPEAVWGRLVDAGVTLIQTDHPQKLVDFLVATERRGKRFSSISMVQDEAFYLLTVLQQLPTTAALTALQQQFSAQTQTALAGCERNDACAFAALTPQPTQQLTLEDAVVEVFQQAQVVKHLRETGYFARYHRLDDQQFLQSAWRETWLALQRVVEVYGQGETPLYPKIDAAQFDLNARDWLGLADDLISKAALQLTDAPEQWLAVYADIAMTLLYLNEREHAASFAELDFNENLLARERIAETQWQDYPYSVILVPGDGPDDVGRELGSYGKLRLKRAVALYQQQQAPFLLVSGGSVHPVGTQINEAMEMKTELMQRYGIAAEAIIVEPHARHTTTNFRNAARLLARYGVPLDKPALVSTSKGQSRYAAGETFATNALRDLGYLPMQFGERLTAFEFSFYPSPLTRQRSPIDPQDP